ncbi:MAG TPA: tetratricopeptide repeat protein, partial [Bacteroidia bacterium]|nr:tetratricopeptide repeat protein [Bacteroidia bacterium]
MRKFLHILFAFIFCTTVFGQDQKLIDSLKIVLKNNKLPDKERARGLARLGWHVSYYDLNEGLKYSQEALTLATRINDIYEKADAANVIGTIYMDLGNYPLAIDYLQKAIIYNDQVSNQKGAAVSASNLCIIYNRRKEYRKALDVAFKAYAYLKKFPSHGLVSTALNIGGTYMEMDMNDSAMYFLNQALDVCTTKDPDSLLESSIYNSMAEVYLNKKDYANAKLYSNKAIGMVSDTTQYYYLAEHYITKANIQLETKEYLQAIASATKALAWSRSIGVKEYEKKCYEILFSAHEFQNNKAGALEFYKLYSQVKDSILNTENERQIKFMESKFEMDKKEKEIELLNKDKKLRDEKILHDKHLINAFILGGIVLLLALCMAVYAFANKRKANKKLQALHNEVHKQRNQLLEKNIAITDSIQYAKRIQNALLTSEEYIQRHVPDFFIINMPKDIVSGDFYWAYAQN